MRLRKAQYRQVAIMLLVAPVVVIDGQLCLAGPPTASLQPDAAGRQAKESEAEELYRLAQQTEAAAANGQELNSAIDQYRRALALGYKKARIALARCYIEHRGVGKDLGKAVDLFREGAAEGDAQAAMLLGWCYEYCLLDDKDVLVGGKKGALLASWLAVLMRENDDRKRYVLESDWGMKAPSRHLPTHAVAWYRLASTKGDVGASFKLACYYIEFDTSNRTLCDYLDRVYARGDARVLLLLGSCYGQIPALLTDSHEQVQCCLILARALATKAAEAHDPDAEHCMGLLYDGVDYIEGADEEKAKYWFGRELVSRLELARAGDILNQYKVGKLLSEGRHVAVDRSTAAHWYERAANEGHPLAQKEIADCYRRALGVAADAGKAAAWAERAAEQDLDAADEPTAGGT